MGNFYRQEFSWAIKVFSGSLYRKLWACAWWKLPDRLQFVFGRFRLKSFDRGGVAPVDRRQRVPEVDPGPHREPLLDLVLLSHLQVNGIVPVKRLPVFDAGIASFAELKKWLEGEFFFCYDFFRNLFPCFAVKLAPLGFFPPPYAGIRTHVSRVVTRDLNSGHSTDWATATAAEAVLFKLHSLKRPEVTKSLYPKLAFKVLVLFEVFKAMV